MKSFGCQNILGKIVIIWIILLYCFRVKYTSNPRPYFITGIFMPGLIFYKKTFDSYLFFCKIAKSYN